MNADDICLFYSHKYTQALRTQIDYHVSILTEYSRCNKLIINPCKTKFVRFKPYILINDKPISICVVGTVIKESDKVKYLGVI